MPTTTVPPAVLVTGASRGLGAVMTERLAAEGYRVFAGVRRPGAPVGNGIVPVILDVTATASIARAVAAVEAQIDGGGLHALVNNAAVLHAGPAEMASPDQIEAQLRTNVAGPLLTTQAFLPLLRRGQGRIVNIGSINAQLPMPNWAVYSASKAALLALSDALRIELAPWNIGGDRAHPRRLRHRHAQPRPGRMGQRYRQSLRTRPARQRPPRRHARQHRRRSRSRRRRPRRPPPSRQSPVTPCRR